MAIGPDEFMAAINELHDEETPDGLLTGADAAAAYESWCERNGVELRAFLAAGNAYIPGFEQWVANGCIRDAAVDMWLHGFQAAWKVRDKRDGELVKQLWEAATGHWHDEEVPLDQQLFDSSTSLPGLPIKGKDLYRIGVELGIIERGDEDS